MSAKAAKPTVPRARLGDDLVPPKPGQPVNVIVARSRIVGGKVEVAVEAPETVRGRPGSKLLVKHAYRLQEDSTDREEYRFLLRSKLGNQEHAPSLARFGDVYAMTEDVGGFLVHEYTLPGRLGEVVLSFWVGAEYTVGEWKSTEVETHDIQQRNGQVRIVVG